MRIIDKWTVSPPTRYGGFGAMTEEIPLLYVAGGQQHPLWQNWPFPTPTIDAQCGRSRIGTVATWGLSACVGRINLVNLGTSFMGAV